MPGEVRTAVVIVHGMGEQRPLDTLNSFVHTALAEVDGERLYYSRPAKWTGSYEARRILAIRRDDDGALVQGQTELFEYHWSYMMTGNRLGDVLPTAFRLLRRPVWMLPKGMRFLWLIVWLVLIALAATLVVLQRRGYIFDEITVAGVLKSVAASGLIVTVVTAVLHWLTSFVTSSFVDVVRYLDTSPRSYEARRAIRGGMVDLLRALQDDGRYSRVVVVAHSLGAYIAYDAITSLWTETHRLHGGPGGADGATQPLDGLSDLEDKADTVLSADGPTDSGPLAEFQERQFKLWQGLRRQGNPWLITDFVSVGTPMYFADLLYTRSHDQFKTLMRRAELPRCPPRSSTETVEGGDAPSVTYGWSNGIREVLTPGTPFAVVRWTNLWFPAKWGIFGDWFGGPLQSLFGPGIRDVEIKGNTPGRYAPGVAHSKYFSYGDSSDPNGAAALIRDALALGIHQELVELRDTAPPVDPETARL